MTRSDMPNDSPDDWSRLARHLAGEDDDAERTRRWIAADPTRTAEADEATSAWHATAPAVDAAAARRAERTADTDAAWARLTARMDAPSSSTTTPRAVPNGTRYVVAAMLAAAAVLAIVVARRPSASPRTYATALGQRATVYLPDGSRAELRSGSTLRVAANGRDVELAGEAAFTVKHDAAHPFRVHARGAVAEDLGTVFDVRAYPEDAAVRVVVAEGAVSVRSFTGKGAPAALHRGDVAALDAAGAVTVTHVDDPDALVAWSRDRLVFRGERLDDVVADLSRTFARRIVVHDSSLAARRVTLDAPARTLTETLGTLGALLGVSIRSAGDSVMLEVGR